MIIYVLFQEDPDDVYRTVFDDLASAEYCLVKLKEDWSDLIRINKVPERKFYIKAFEEINV